MSNRQQVVKKVATITCLKKNELRQIHGGIGKREESIVVATSTVVGAAIGGAHGAIAGHRIGTASVWVLKEFSKKKKRR